MPYQRIVIIGATSSGKSTLAKFLATKFNLKYIDLDDLFWEPNWKKSELEVFRERVLSATQTESWAIAGNYRVVSDIIWPKAQLIIWLDYSLPRILWQLTRRTLNRWWNKELICGANRESLRMHLQIWSEKSLYHWLFKTYWKKKRHYSQILSKPENQYLQLIHLKSPHEMNEWLKNF